MNVNSFSPRFVFETVSLLQFDELSLQDMSSRNTNLFTMRTRTKHGITRHCDETVMANTMVDDTPMSENTFPKEEVFPKVEFKISQPRSLLDTLAEIACQIEPITSPATEDEDSGHKETPMQKRPRAMSEPWTSEYSVRKSPITKRDPPQFSTLPQMLDKYSAIYNKNGRIGIYTREERDDIIHRFREKRKRRVWTKKIRYHCRKNLADSRVRVKGRFVKSQTEALLNDTSGMDLLLQATQYEEEEDESPSPTAESVETDSASAKEFPNKRMRRHSIAY